MKGPPRGKQKGLPAFKLVPFFFFFLKQHMAEEAFTMQEVTNEVTKK